MHIFATVPLGLGGAPPSQVVRDLVVDLFGPGAPPWPGDYWFVRTWDRSDGSECLQISLRSAAVRTGEARDRVVRAAAARGVPSSVTEAPWTEVPSPLWNCGIGGAGFDAASKRLCSAVAPVLVRAAVEIGNGGTAASYLLAMRLMVANAGATLLDSDQRQLSPRAFDELLSLRLLSYRSHYEGAKHAQATDPVAFDRRCAAYYDELGAHARDLVRACGASPVPAAGDTAGDTAGAWADVVRRHSRTLREQCRAGLIAHDGPTLDDVDEGRDVPLQRSEFHSVVSREMSDLLHRNADFLAYRIAASLLYSSLYTLGFSLAERFLFCYLLARANEDVSGRSPEELARALDDVAREFAHR